MGKRDIETMGVLAAQVKNKAKAIQTKKMVKRMSKPRLSKMTTTLLSYDDAIDAVVQNARLENILDSVAKHESKKQRKSVENDLEMRTKSLPNSSKFAQSSSHKETIKIPDVLSGPKRKAKSLSPESHLCSPIKSTKLETSSNTDSRFPFRRRKINGTDNDATNQSRQVDLCSQNSIGPNPRSSLMRCRHSHKPHRGTGKKHSDKISNNVENGVLDKITTSSAKTRVDGLQMAANGHRSSQFKHKHDKCSVHKEKCAKRNSVQSEELSASSVDKVNKKISRKAIQNQNVGNKGMEYKKSDPKQTIVAKLISREMLGEKKHVKSVNGLKHTRERKHESKPDHHKANLETSCDIKLNSISAKRVKKDFSGKKSTKTHLKVKFVKSSSDKKQKEKDLVSKLLPKSEQNTLDNSNVSVIDKNELRKIRKKLYSPLKLKKGDDNIDVDSDTESDDNVLYSLSPEVGSSQETVESGSQRLCDDNQSHNSGKSKSETVVKDKGQMTNTDSNKSNRSQSSAVLATSGKSKGKMVRLIDSLKSTAATEPVPVRPVSTTSLFTTVKPSPVLPTSSSQPPHARSHLARDFLAYQYVVQPSTAVIPISPSSMSYQMLMENLPHQLHPRKKVGKGAGPPEEEVERRVSVRSSECAFKYKEIIVKKCNKYTQIWLHTHTQMRNALNPQVIQEIVSALNAAKYDDSNIVMFSGLGNVFCSGIDLHFLTTGDKKVAARQMVDALRDFTKTFITFPKLIVAVVPGPAMGLGMTMLPLCDVVYASDKATFHLPYTQLSQTPEGGASYTLPHCIGIAMANELLFGGRKITAIEACQLGLISQVYWPTSMMQEVIPRIQNMALQSGKVLETTKLLVRSHQRTKLDLTNESESNLLLERWPSPECQKAITDYLSDEKNYNL